MSDQASRFIGSIPEHYDCGLGPRIFFDYADDLAARVASAKPTSVLELAGTGIVTQRLRSGHEVANIERPVNFFHRSRFLVKTSADLIIRGFQSPVRHIEF